VPRGLRAWLCCSAVLLGLNNPLQATPDFVEHIPSAQVYGEPAGVTMREPDVPREEETIDLWIRIGYSFWYTDVAIYYTIDGAEPEGAMGTPGNGSTQVLTSAAGQITFIRNEPHQPNNIDWWEATLPAETRGYGLTIKYKISAWHSGGGEELFANSYGGVNTPTTFPYTVKLAWPGAGYPNPDPGAGYPQVHFWKEEGVVGNNYINVMIDQNGSLYDVYYPTVGCRWGMGTKNEGYADGDDTFPPGLPPDHRGQMNLNQGTVGLRVGGLTYWLTNEAGDAYTSVAQQYVTDTNVLHTWQTLTAGGHDIRVDQYDMCPKGITFSTDNGGKPVRGFYIKRLLLTNNSASPQTINVYFNCDFALNGGDIYDVMFVDAARGAMIAYDNTYRLTSSSGEYNPTSFGDYEKNVSVYLAAALKLCDSVGGASGTLASDFWRDSSSDDDQGWIGLKLTLDAFEQKEVDLIMVGGFDDFAGATGTYDYQIAPVLDWFSTTSMAAVQTQTESYWTDWLAAGVTIDFPGSAYDALFTRGLLATALHVDGQFGGIIAGMHNGAYPFVWPRDALYAAVTLDRTGHHAEAEAVYAFLRDVCYRDEEEPGRKGFWYQKYTTNGYIVWNAPQVDETACVPWAAFYHYKATGDLAFLNNYYTMIYEAARAASEDSNIDSRLYYDDPYDLMHSNNVWEDAWDDFIYSNASVERGLRDAASIAALTGHSADAAMFTSRADAIHGGILARLDWDGENTDISHLGLVYPFAVLDADESRVLHVVDRMNGDATDRYGQNHPILRVGGEWDGLVDRYWGDTYWNGGPWFLSTAWYGMYYAELQDLRPGKEYIDIAKAKLDLLIQALGPLGLGAEQIAPSSSLQYPGQTDFVLQAAWPNAWESMSTLVDGLMLFVDYQPDAAAATCQLEPKLPAAWDTITVHNLPLGDERFDVTYTESPTTSTLQFTNRTGGVIHYDVYLRIPADRTILVVTQDGSPISYSHDDATGRVHVTASLNTGAGSSTTIEVDFHTPGDIDRDGDVDLDDYASLQACYTGPIGPLPPDCDEADLDGDDDVDLIDLATFQVNYAGS